MKRPILLATLVTVCLAPLAASAAECAKTDLLGKWVVTFSTGEICSLTTNKAGGLKKSECYLDTVDNVVGKLNGRLKVHADCRIRGTMVQNFEAARDTLKVSGTLSDAGVDAVGKGKGGRLVSFTMIRDVDEILP